MLHEATAVTREPTTELEFAAESMEALRLTHGRFFEERPGMS
jgi:hypothetical protein